MVEDQLGLQQVGISSVKVSRHTLSRNGHVEEQPDKLSEKKPSKRLTDP